MCIIFITIILIIKFGIKGLFCKNLVFRALLWTCDVQQSPYRLASHSHPASPVSPKCRSKAHFQPQTLWPLHRRAHQILLAPRAGANYIQGGDADVSCPAWFHTTLLGVVIHMCRQHSAPTRAQVPSDSTEQLDVPTCRRSTIGGRAFPVARAKVWNSLPSDVTSASSLPMFKNRLKTYLFRRCYENVWLSITFPFPSHYLPPQDSGPCNSFYCLGHFKNVYVDDDVTGMSYDFVVRYSLRLS